ncbi:MAG: Gfo/Idh/MocA family oxidoreductase, partial [Caldilinea sp.]|nr:Gfo/Idh/MocA family oxidoreductase [Caldilinea sp.]
MIAKEAQRLRVGVLGAGPISQFAHLEATRKARNAELVAICDVAEDLLARMAAIHMPVRTYTRYDAMLADPEIDAVIIGVADQYHVPLAQRAIDAGKHVLVEKPLGVSIEECETLRAAVQASGPVLQVGNNRRLDPGVPFARTFIREQPGQAMALNA